MIDSITFATKADAERCAAAVDVATNSGRKLTQTDVDSGLVVFVGDCHTRVEDLRAKPWAEIVERDGAFFYPWSPKLAKYAGKDGVPSGPNAEMPIDAAKETA